MASLPAQHPSLSLHLTDLSLTPLITSSSSRAHLESLTSLASSAITSSVAAQRANLGRPQRIMVEYPDSGAVVLHSFLHPPAAEQHEEGSNSNNSNNLNTSRDDAGDTSNSNSNQINNPNPSGGNDSGDSIRNSSSSARSAGAGANNSNNSSSNSSKNDMGVNNPDNDEDGVPLLVGLVVAGSRDQAREARRVAARLERVGREFQREWAAQGALHRPEEE